MSTSFFEDFYTVVSVDKSAVVRCLYADSEYSDRAPWGCPAPPPQNSLRTSARLFADYKDVPRSSDGEDWWGTRKYWDGQAYRDGEATHPGVVRVYSECDEG